MIRAWPVVRASSATASASVAAAGRLAREKLGVPNLHFHDLRHTGNTFAAESGANLRDLMERKGHDSVRAALIYQHRSVGGNRMIANAMDDKIAQGDPDDEDLPAALARVG
jgi:integrase